MQYATHVSIREPTSAYVSIRGYANLVVVRHARMQRYLLVLDIVDIRAIEGHFIGKCPALCLARGRRLPAYVSIRQHTSAYVSMRQHASAYANAQRSASPEGGDCQHTSAYVSQHTSACVSIRSVMRSAYVSIRQHTSYVSRADGGYQADEVP
jgi:hypothetical protein